MEVQDIFADFYHVIFFINGKYVKNTAKKRCQIKYAVALLLEDIYAKDTVLVSE